MNLIDVKYFYPQSSNQNIGTPKTYEMWIKSVEWSKQIFKNRRQTVSKPAQGNDVINMYFPHK